MRSDRHVAAGFALAAALLTFFVVTLDAVVVNVALPSISDGLGGGITALQWVVDGYTLTFAALLLSSGSLADRIGARRALGVGMVLFVAASVACGAASTIELLVTARFVQGAAAAIIMPASLTLVSQSYPDGRQRARAVGIWALGGAVASTSGPVIGGLLTLLDWRLIFFINVPAGAIALWMLRPVAPSTRRPAPFDWWGQVTAVVAMGSLTFGAIEAGSAGVSAPRVLVAVALSVLSTAGFVLTQSRVRHPMVPLDMFHERTLRIALGTGFAFMVGYYGMPFLFSLYLQGERGLNSLSTGIVFLPMMLVGLALTPFSARIAERIGARATITGGLAAMAMGVAALALVPAATPVWLLSLLMVMVGIGGPLTMPPMTAVLLNHALPQRTGVASAMFNTSRQVGGALGIAVFGALLAHHDFMAGLRSSLLIAAGLLLAAMLATLRLPPP